MKFGYYLVIKEDDQVSYAGPYLSKDEAERSYNILKYLNSLSETEEYFLILIGNKNQGQKFSWLLANAKVVDFPKGSNNAINSSNVLNHLKNRSLQVKKRIATKTDSPKVLDVLAEDEDSHIRKIVAFNKDTSSETLEKLCNDDVFLIQEGLAKDGKTPSRVLRQLYKNPNCIYDIAGNLNTPIDILTQLSENDQNEIRKKIADNPSAPQDVLVKLAQDTNSTVRWNVAGHENTPIEILHILSSDTQIIVRKQVARNFKTPVEVLKRLSESEDLFVRAEVARNSNSSTEILSKLAKDDSRHVRQGVAMHKNTSADDLYTLSLSYDERIKCCVASNINLTPEILLKLADDESSTVRQQAARHVNTPPESLVKLLKDEDDYVRANAYGNPNLPNEIKVLMEMFKPDIA